MKILGPLRPNKTAPPFIFLGEEDSILMYLTFNKQTFQIEKIDICSGQYVDVRPTSFF